MRINLTDLVIVILLKTFLENVQVVSIKQTAIQNIKI
jgi:hypothetical protein